MSNKCRSSAGLVTAGLICGGALALWAVGRGMSRRARARALPTRRDPEGITGQPVSVRSGDDAPSREFSRKAVRRFNEAAEVLSLSVLTDSTLEHYRGCFFNPAMYTAPAVSAVVLTETASETVLKRSAAKPVRRGVFGAALLAGLAGTGFHLYNISKREGGFSWLNLFYAAPIGAPGAVAMAGLFGLASAWLCDSDGVPQLLGLDGGRVLAGLTVFGIAGTVAEALLLHYRGAFHDPFMFTPVVLPSLSGAVLLAAAVRPTPRSLRAARVAMNVTGWVGLAGVGFHSYGIHRNMGGWYNWSQMILQGPPLPAPLGFTGMALAGLGAVALLEEGGDKP